MDSHTFPPRPRIVLGEQRTYNTSPEHFVHGDIWTTAWAPDDTLYMLTDDFYGWQGEFMPEGRNVSFCRLDGTPSDLRGETINDFSELGIAGDLGVDGANWKGSGIAHIDGRLYMFISRQWYGRYSPGKRETKHDAYLLRSDDGGASWTWSQDGNGDRAPLFPGPGFAAPYFVEYGQDGSAPAKDRADEFVYAVSSDGAWDNGDCMTLARVRKDRIGELSADDWEFFRGGDGAEDAAWGAAAQSGSAFVVEPIISAIRRCSMTGMHYIPGIDQYLVMQWHYPDLSPRDLATDRTIWEFYLAPHPWGPFQEAGRWEWPGIGFYNPVIPNKFLSEDGRSGTILTTGNFQTYLEPWDSTQYTMYTIPFTFEEA